MIIKYDIIKISVILEYNIRKIYWFCMFFLVRVIEIYRFFKYAI